MTQAYSEDLRARALARADRGETIRLIAAALQISPSCVSKWKKLRRETGDLKPGKMNGHKKRVLSGAHAEWLRERIRSGPFTLRKLTAELAARGIKTHHKAVWIFVHAEGLSFKKNRAADGTVTSGYRPQAGAMEGASGQD
jgi:putative transposase